MNRAPFIHLHVHSHYSLLDGLCRIPEIVNFAVEQHMPAIALTDHDGMYGAVDFYKAAVARGVKPIIGVELGVANVDSQRARVHLVLLAENDLGYAHLLKLVSAAHLGPATPPIATWEMLGSYGRGLIALTGCRAGPFGGGLCGADPAGDARACARLVEIFGRDNCFVELENHGLPEDEARIRALCAVAASAGLGVVATNNAHYLRREHAGSQEVMMCIGAQRTLSDPHHPRLGNDQYYLKPAAEMAELFRTVPGAVANTLLIADRCDVTLRLGDLHFPQFPMSANIPPRDHLVAFCRTGLWRRYRVENPDHPRDDRERAIVARYHHELAVVEKTRFVNYFLVVADFVNYAREQGIAVGPGRGSGAGSLLAYILGITDIDPLEFGLIFERFLNPSRRSPPDFDIDFCQLRRGEVIDYVRRKYGRDRVAQIITFNTLGARAVLRDVGRVLDMPAVECDRLARMVAEADDHTLSLRRVLDQHAGLQAEYAAPDGTFRRVADHALVLEGLNRNAGTHAAGVVIGPSPLTDLVPLTRDREGQIITQYGMESLAAVGLLKMDFLGLKTLTVIRQAETIIRNTGSPGFDIGLIPRDDARTFALLRRGDTQGLFQVESGGMRDLLRRLGIASLVDLMALIALYRPGPMNMLDDYISRKTGATPVKYDHPRLKPILAETYGVLIYQEQVLMAAHALAGFTMAEGDTLRRAMSKQDPDLMESMRDKFIAGCARSHRIPQGQAENLFDTLARFGGYGFNKSHSAAYALIAYQTAYLKANHPLAFMTALLVNESGNYEKMSDLIREAGAMGVAILPPDINSSAADFTTEGNAIRFGLAGVKHVGILAARAIEAERRRGGPFPGLADFGRRVDEQSVNRKVMESLIRSGAFDATGLHRARLLSGLEPLLASAWRQQRDLRRGQGLLFQAETAAMTASDAAVFPECAPWPESRLLADERELLGIFLSGHPLKRYAWLLEHFQLTTAKGLHTLPNGALTRVGGLIGAVNRRLTRDGEMMATMRIEDLDGVFDAIVYPDLLKRSEALLRPDTAVLLCGTVQPGDPPRVTVTAVSLLDDAPRDLARRVGMQIPAANLNEELLTAIRGILHRHGGATPVSPCILYPSGKKIILNTGPGFRVLVSEALIRDLELLLGEKTVYVEIDSEPCPREIRD